MYGTSTGSHCACAPWSAEVAGVARLFRVSRFIQALSAGFTPLAVPLPDACCLPLTSLRTCGLSQATPPFVSLPFNQQQQTGIQKEVGERRTILGCELIMRSI